MEDDDDLTEFEDIFPSRVDAVGVPANGIGFIVLKSLGEQSPKKKGKHMKAKKLAKEAAAVEALRAQMESIHKQIGALDRNNGAVGSLATVTAAHQRGLGGMSDPFQTFETRVKRAQSDVEKARQAGDDYSLATARTELLQAKSQLTKAKMMAAETARQHDPATINARLSGRGVPVLTNRHALPPDDGPHGLRYQ